MTFLIPALVVYTLGFLITLIRFTLEMSSDLSRDEPTLNDKANTQTYYKLALSLVLISLLWPLAWTI